MHVTAMNASQRGALMTTRSGVVLVEPADAQQVLRFRRSWGERRMRGGADEHDDESEDRAAVHARRANSDHHEVREE